MNFFARILRHLLLRGIGRCKRDNRFSQGNFPVLRHDSRFMGILQRNEGRYKRNKQGLRQRKPVRLGW